jgi:hypothetical protein
LCPLCAFATEQTTCTANKGAFLTGPVTTSPKFQAASQTIQGIHWAHTNCGATPTTTAPNGWTRTISSTGSVSANLERSTTYGYLWN